jgi:hypothetical protein
MPLKVVVKAIYKAAAAGERSVKSWPLQWLLLLLLLLLWK